MSGRENNREGAEGVLGWDAILNRVDREGLAEEPSQTLLAEHRRWRSESCGYGGQEEYCPLRELRAQRLRSRCMPGVLQKYVAKRPVWLEYRPQWGKGKGDEAVEEHCGVDG